MKKRMQMLGVCRVDSTIKQCRVFAKSTSLIKNDLVLVFVVVAISSISLGLIQDHYIGITHMLWDLSMVQIENQEYCTYEEGWCILVLFQNFGFFFFIVGRLSTCKFINVLLQFLMGGFLVLSSLEVREFASG